MQNAFKYYKMAKYLASVHTAQKKKQQKVIKEARSPSVLHVSDTSSPNPSP